MPSVDVDVTAIPDMIEAQLTLSYSRLAHLVRLIVDQGNGHDVDIDKLTNRIDALTKENAELKSLVESLIAEKSRDNGVQSTLDELKREISRISDNCAENSRQMSATAEEVKKRFSDVDQRINNEAKMRAADIDQLQNPIKELQEFNHVIERTMRTFDSFLVLWESQKDKVEALTMYNSEGEEIHTTEERVAYLHSLPAFSTLFDELDVLRQMLRQQASDALAAKNVAGAIRRISTAENAAGTAVDRTLLDTLQESLDSMNKRMKVLESRRIPALEQAQRQQQQQQQQLQQQSNNQSQPLLQPLAINNNNTTTTNNNNQHHQQQEELKRNSTTSSIEKEEINKIDNRLQHVESRLRNLTLQASDGTSIDKAVLMDIEGRLRSLEEAVDGIKFVPIPSQSKSGEDDLPPIISSKRFSSTQSPAALPRPLSASSSKRGSGLTGGEGEALAPVTGGGGAASELNTGKPRPATGSGSGSGMGVAYHQPQGMRSSIDQPNVETYRRQSLSTANTPQSPKVQVLEQENGLTRRVAQLEENSAILEMKKADRQELAQLEEAIRQILLNPTAMQSSPMMRGMTPHRPLTSGEARVGYNTEGMYGNSSIPGVRSSTPSRPVYVAGSSHCLRDSTGKKTSASIAYLHPQ